MELRSVIVDECGTIKRYWQPIILIWKMKIFRRTS